MSGPFETEGEARAAVGYIHEAAHGSIRRKVIGELNHQMLSDVASTTGVPKGAYDLRIVARLAGFEPETCAVPAWLITRAHGAGRAAPAPEALAAGMSPSPEQIRTVLNAVDVADYERKWAETCGDCDAGPGDLYATCEYRLATVGKYDALARPLAGPGEGAVSRFDNKDSQRIAMTGHPFHAMVMAAMRQAGTENATSLGLAFPESWDEPGERHDSPGGLILDDCRTEKYAAHAGGRCEHDRHQAGGPLEPAWSRQPRGER